MPLSRKTTDKQGLSVFTSEWSTALTLQQGVFVVAGRFGRFLSCGLYRRAGASSLGLVNAAGQTWYHVGAVETGVTGAQVAGAGRGERLGVVEAADVLDGGEERSPELGALELAGLHVADVLVVDLAPHEPVGLGGHDLGVAREEVVPPVHAGLAVVEGVGPLGELEDLLDLLEDEVDGLVVLEILVVDQPLDDLVLFGLGQTRLFAPGSRAAR